MSGYKLVPVEPTAEMVEAAQDAYMPFGDMDIALRMALLAAPAVQGEPVGWQFYHDGKWWYGDDRIKDHRNNTEAAGYPVRDVYGAPHPEPIAPTFQLGDHVRKTKGSQWKGRVVGTYSTTLTPEGYAVESDTEKGSVQIYPVRALELVGEDAEPDVSALVEALDLARNDLSDWIASFPESSHAFTVRVIARIDAAMAAHRKQEST